MNGVTGRMERAESNGNHPIHSLFHLVGSRHGGEYWLEPDPEHVNKTNKWKPWDHQLSHSSRVLKTCCYFVSQLFEIKLTFPFICALKKKSWGPACSAAVLHSFCVISTKIVCYVLGTELADVKFNSCTLSETWILEVTRFHWSWQKKTWWLGQKKEPIFFYVLVLCLVKFRKWCWFSVSKGFFLLLNYKVKGTISLMMSWQCRIAFWWNGWFQLTLSFTIWATAEVHYITV